LNPTLPLLVGFLTLFGLASVHAADICWVERVKRTPTGIDAYFMEGRVVTLIRDKRQVGLFQTYSASTTTVRQLDGMTAVEAVSAQLGDRLFSSNSPHDSCSLMVVIRDGKIGLEASASMQMGIEPPNTAQKFIPAE
jgi:hypothetical protein